MVLALFFSSEKIMASFRDADRRLYPFKVVCSLLDSGDSGRFQPLPTDQGLLTLGNFLMVQKNWGANIAYAPSIFDNVEKFLISSPHAKYQNGALNPASCFVLMTMGQLLLVRQAKAEKTSSKV